MRHLILAFSLFPAMLMADTLNIRQIDRVVDVQQSSITEAIEWYRGESVQYNVFVRRANLPVSVPSDAVPVLKAWRTNDLNTLYIVATGTVVSAGGNQVRVELNASQANLPAGAYATAMQLWQGTNVMGISAYAALAVRWSPAGDSIAYVGTTNDPWIARSEFSISQGTSNHWAAATDTLYLRSNYATGTPLYVESDPKFIAASNALLTEAEAAAIYATGTPVYVVGPATDSTARAWAQAASNLALQAASASVDATARAWAQSASNLAASAATGTPLYAESDPLFIAASNALLTKAQASALYATGTPVYAISGLGTDTYARTTAEWASNRANAAHSIASAAATGTPIYSVSGLATGTPIYSVAGLATGTPIYSVAGLATGTPLYVESFTGSVGSLSGYMPSSSVTDAITTLSFPLASGVNVSQRVAAVEGAGYILGSTASNSFVILNTANTGSLWIARTNLYEHFIGFGVGDEINGSVSGVFRGGTNRFFISAAVIFDVPDLGLSGGATFGADYIKAIDFIGGGAGITNINGANITNAPAAWTNQSSLFALSNAIVTAGASSTNFGLAIGAGATSLVAGASAAGTNFALAVGAGNSNLTMSAWSTASNGLATAQAAQVQASNINAGAWSQVATGDVNMASSGINSARWVQVLSGHNGEAPAGSFQRSTANLQWKSNDGSTNTVAHSGNLTTVGAQTTAGFNTATTNTLWRWSGFIQGGTGQRGNMYESNGWLYVWSDASNGYGRVQLGF